MLDTDNIRNYLYEPEYSAEDLRHADSETAAAGESEPAAPPELTTRPRSRQRRIGARRSGARHRTRARVIVTAAAAELGAPAGLTAADDPALHCVPVHTSSPMLSVSVSSKVPVSAKDNSSSTRCRRTFSSAPPPDLLPFTVDQKGE